MDPAKINRINELSKISKERKLTPAELIEQEQLKYDFLQNFKEGFEKQLQNIKVVKVDDKK